MQVKRLHEYKRQLLNALCIMDLYLSIKDGTLTDFTPTAFIFGAKAAPATAARKRSFIMSTALPNSSTTTRPWKAS